MDDEAELLRAVLSRLPAPPANPWAMLLREPDPDPSLPLRDALADRLAARGRWPGDPAAGGTPGCGHEFPAVIRVADLRLRGEPFRVRRCAACGGRLWADRIPGELFSEHFVLWPLPDTEEEILRFVAGFGPAARLVRGDGTGGDRRAGATPGG